jgi:hypothetical protein
MPKTKQKIVISAKQQAKPSRGGAGRGQGRKRLQEGADTVPVSIKMTEPQRDKLRRLGGAPWVRARIDKAKDPE